MHLPRKHVERGKNVYGTRGVKKLQEKEMAGKFQSGFRI